MKSYEPNLAYRHDPSLENHSQRLPQTEAEHHPAIQPVTLAHPMFKMYRMLGNHFMQHALADTSNGEDETEVAPEMMGAIQRSRGGGQTLDSRIRGQMESAFGAEFSGVRVHADAEADKLNRTLNARAFTIGEDIFFRHGEYGPSSSNGRELITHELTHVVQQTGAVQMKLKIGEPGDEYEQQADQFARQVTQSFHISPAGVRTRFNPIQHTTIQRQKDGPGEELKTAFASIVERALLRSEMIFHRRKIQALRKDLTVTSLSSKREELQQEVFKHETELLKALESHIPLLKQYLKNLQGISPFIDIFIAEDAVELKENEVELKILERIFRPETAAAFAEKYKKEVRPLPGGGCMTAVYKGLESLYSPKESTATRQEVWKDSQEILKKTKIDTNSVDRIMETLRKHGKAGDPLTLRFTPRKNIWVPGLQETVLKMVNPEYPGWYFFGLSVSGGWHSVVLAVDNSQGGAPQIYWMDQYSKGFTNNVTGKLDTKLKENWLTPTYGYADTKVWPLLPTSDTVVEIK